MKAKHLAMLSAQVGSPQALANRLEALASRARNASGKELASIYREMDKIRLQRARVLASRTRRGTR